MTEEDKPELVKHKRRYRNSDGSLGGELHPNFQVKKKTGQKLGSKRGKRKKQSIGMPKLPDPNPDGHTPWQREPRMVYTRAKVMWFQGMSYQDITDTLGVPGYILRAWVYGYSKNERGHYLATNQIYSWAKERRKIEEDAAKAVYRDMKKQIKDTLNNTLTDIERGVQKLHLSNKELTPSELSSLTKTLESLRSLEELEADKMASGAKRTGTKYTKRVIIDLLKEADPIVSYTQESDDEQSEGALTTKQD